MCQNDTVYKLNQNILYNYFFLFCNKRIRQAASFVLCVFLYICRLETKFEIKSIFLFYNLAERFNSLGFYGHPYEMTAGFSLQDPSVRNLFDYGLGGEIER